MKEKQNRKWSVKRILFTVGVSFLVLLLLITAVALLYINHMLNKINKIDPEMDYTISSSEADDLLYNDPDLMPMDPDPSESYPQLDDIVPPDQEDQPATKPPASEENQSKPTEEPTVPKGDIFGDHLLNVLLVGQDRREGQGRQRSDTMILVTLNKSNKTITLTSFMRDQYVRIPGYRSNKLNAAYAFGGMSLLSKTLELNFGVKVDGVVEVDFSGFTKVIDLLGGVNVTLTKAEAKYLNDLYEAKFIQNGVVVGANRLDGEQALVYVRLREIDSDYKRASRQREVIQGIIEAYKDLPLTEMLGMLDEILPIISTNFSNSQILGYAADFFMMLASAQVQTMRIPLDGTFSSGMVEVRENYYGWFQYNINFSANKKALYEVFRARN